MTWPLDGGRHELFVIEDEFYRRDPSTYHERAFESDRRHYRHNAEGQVRMNLGGGRRSR